MWQDIEADEVDFASTKVTVFITVNTMKHEKGRIVPKCIQMKMAESASVGEMENAV